MGKRFMALLMCVIMGISLLSACNTAGGGSGDLTPDKEMDSQVQTDAQTPGKADLQTDGANMQDTESADKEGTDGNGVVTGYSWDGESETDKIHYTELEAKLGEITPDMVPEGFSIGVVSMEAANTYWVDLNKGVEDRCRELGIEVDVEYVVGPTNFEETLAKAETLYGIGYDAYIFSPENETCLEEITKKIVDEGIPVINAYCCQISSATCLIGSLDSETAIASAKKAIELVGNDGTVAIAMGDIATKLAQTRTNYFKKYLEENSNITIEEIPAQWDPSNARTMTADLLTANPDVGYIWCNNDALGLGAYEGVREAGLTDQIKVVSMDGTTAAFSSLQAGEIYGTFANYPQLIGRLSVDACVRAVLGQKLPRVIQTDVAFVTADNVDEYLSEQ